MSTWSSANGECFFVAQSPTGWEPIQSFLLGELSLPGLKKEYQEATGSPLNVALWEPEIDMFLDMDNRNEVARRAAVAKAEELKAILSANYGENS